MTDSPGPKPDESREIRAPHRLIVRAVLRAVASICALVAIYYLLPLDRASVSTTVVMLAIGLVLLTGLVALQVRSIIESPFPRLRAMEALAISVPLFLLLFAATYTVMSGISVDDFSEPLTRTDALYFSITVFATVGFGDITAKAEAARLVVTGQMVADVVIVGLAAKAIAGAISHGRKRRSSADHSTRS
jgi:voltage-gated potassium channel